MPQLMKLVWGGALGTNESWSCSLHGLADDGAGPSVGTTIAPALTAFHGNVATGISSFAHLDYIKLNFISANGKYATPDLPNTFDVIPSVPGTTVGGPFQIALCVTLLTAAPRGRASKGRIYLPSGAMSGVDANGQFPLAGATNVIGTMNTLLLALRTGGFDPQVYSIVGQTGRPITHVRVGRVMDTQRRRRRSNPEAYVVGAAF